MRTTEYSSMSLLMGLLPSGPLSVGIKRIRHVIPTVKRRGGVGKKEDDFTCSPCFQSTFPLYDSCSFLYPVYSPELGLIKWAESIKTLRHVWSWGSKPDEFMMLLGKEDISMRQRRKSSRQELRIKLWGGEFSEKPNKHSGFRQEGGFVEGICLEEGSGSEMIRKEERSISDEEHCV